MNLFNSKTYIVRRTALMALLPSSGVVLLPGNGLSPMNYPSNSYHFRQDSTFRYFGGLNLPDLFLLLDLDRGESHLFGAEVTMDDIIWSGNLPTLSELGTRVGIENSHPIGELKGYIKNRKVHILPPYRGEMKIRLSELLECSIEQLKGYYSSELAEKVAQLREIKSEEELAEIEKIYAVGYRMHTTAMAMASEGRIEREIAGELAGIAHRYGAGVSFQTICSQRGQVLHNVSLDGRLERGRLLLVDAGAESLSGYVSDHTRTFPVGGRFSERQRDIYNIVLAAHNHVREVLHGGMLYSELQAACYHRLAEGLLDYGLLRGAMDEILECGAMRLFMPHGVSHGIGLDVHDCEAFGERSLDLGLKSESCITRSTWRLRPSAVISNEPGLYFIEPLIERSRSEGLYSSVVNYELLREFYSFGGIRIEDDLIITADGCREVGAEQPIPKSVAEIENFMESNQL